MMIYIATHCCFDIVSLNSLHVLVHNDHIQEDGLSMSHVTKHRTTQYVKLYVPAAIVGAENGTF
jgi:hypothetical protein